MTSPRPRETGVRATAPLLRQLHTREVLGVLQRRGPLSRAEIVRLTGISGPTVTRTTAQLLAAGLIEEGPSQHPPLGRPARVLRLATATVSVLGLVVGVEQCELVAAGLDGQVDTANVDTANVDTAHDDTANVESAQRIAFPTPRSYEQLIASAAEQIEQFRAATNTNVLGLGITVPGLLSRHDKRTLISPNLHQTDGRQLGLDLQRATGLEVAILQETHALCLAEKTYGAARDVANFAMLDITGGLGLGIVDGGKILGGYNGLAGELGHVTVELDGRTCGCGNRGCLETVATDAALCDLVAERLGTRLSANELLAQLKSGEIQAPRELDLVLCYVAVALAAVINLFNPQKLFVYGRLLDVEPQIFDDLVERTTRRSLAPSRADCEIIRAQGNKRQGAVAAIIEQLMSDDSR
jgi:predicted NBD/HSP70 family sugar kinase